MINTLVVIAKRPEPGTVKTRLVPPLTYGQAAELAAAALTDTIDAIALTPARRRLLAFDGPVEGWLRPGWRTCRQPSGDLDQRLAAAFLAAGSGPALLVGMDTPQLRPDQLTRFDPIRYDACLGRARDGGYWAIGFGDPRVAPLAIEGVPMSTDRTADEQLTRLAALGLRVQILDELVDVDTIDEVDAVATAAPASAFAAALRRVAAPVAQAG